MLETKPHPIRATLTVWGAGPGMGGTSYIEFVPAADGWHVFGGGSATDGREELGTLPPDSGWRDRVEFVVNNVCPAHEDHAPDDVRLTGADGAETKLLKMAWSGPAGCRAAEILLELSEDALERILVSSDGGECVAEIERLQAAIDDDAEIVELIRMVVRSGTFCWEDVQAAAQKRAEAEPRGLITGGAVQTLTPVEQEIARIVSSWRAQQRVATQAADMIRSAKVTALQSFLVGYVREHGRLPTGQHLIPVRFMGRSMTLNVNFDQLSGG